MAIQIHDKKFEQYISAETITAQVKKLAIQINEDYQGKQPVFIAILNGAFMFAADLFKEITIEAEISFIKLVSYKGTTSTGSVITAIGLEEVLKGRHIIVIEDIVDTGNTLATFLPQLYNQLPASLKVAALLNKPEATEQPVTIDYLGFSVPDKFLVGYGLDYDGLGRNLPSIYQLTN
ncbi:MAG: hypoxanthine phosphoribosyltransferase [Sphingobacteriales bacterium]|nr:hypoxanthine phosphoribosyltransferase [Sphingobacteriales bacterium]